LSQSVSQHWMTCKSRVAACACFPVNTVALSAACLFVVCFVALQDSVSAASGQQLLRNQVSRAAGHKDQAAVAGWSLGCCAAARGAGDVLHCCWSLAGPTATVVQSCGLLHVRVGMMMMMMMMMFVLAASTAKADMQSRHMSSCVLCFLACNSN
jgi:hypothetical protein